MKNATALGAEIKTRFFVESGAKHHFQQKIWF
jgi:hypothetical protein